MVTYYMWKNMVYCAWLLNASYWTWVLGIKRRMIQLAQGPHEIQFTCWWTPLLVCRDHESISKTLRDSSLSWCSRPSILSPHPSQTVASRNLWYSVCLKTLPCFSSTKPWYSWNHGLLISQQASSVIFVESLVDSTYQLFQPVVIIFSTQFPEVFVPLFYDTTGSFWVFI